MGITGLPHIVAQLSDCATCKWNDFVLVIALLAAGAMVAACANNSRSSQQIESSHPVPSSEEILNSRIAYDDCLSVAARQNDDGKSDASTIALAIKSRCIPQAERHIRAVAAAMVGPGITPAAAYVSAKKTFDELYLEDGVKAVLTERTKRR
jgi:hypothetical protein